eukprot:3541410-Amphidinium_carterae.1
MLLLAWRRVWNWSNARSTEQAHAAVDCEPPWCPCPSKDDGPPAPQGPAQLRDRSVEARPGQYFHWPGAAAPPQGVVLVPDATDPPRVIWMLNR